MNNATVRRVVLLGALAIAGIIALQGYFVNRSWSQAANNFDQDVKIALLKVARNMAIFNGSTLPSRDLIKRIHANYYVVNFNDIIDANVLEYYLLNEFEALNINTPFEYAIYDCSSDEMVYGNYCSVEDAEMSAAGGQKLLKYDEFIYYFGVKFPARSTFLLGDMRLAIIFSLITLTALLFFAYAIFVMLTQKRLSELQRDFINNMTHEFKTPISSIKISSDLFANDPKIQADPRLAQYAGIIKSQNERLNRQVEKVLNIARIGDDQFELNREEVDIHHIIREVTESKSPEVKQLGGRFIHELEAENTLVYADPLHLTNVLFNLVDNAIKYSKDAPEIRIRTESQGNKLSVSVVDKGIGIAKDQQKHLFKRFFRVSTGNVHNVKGFGLGLHYVKRIVELHKWKIYLKSEPGKGTTMTIEIPGNSAR